MCLCWRGDTQSSDQVERCARVEVSVVNNGVVVSRQFVVRGAVALALPSSRAMLQGSLEWMLKRWARVPMQLQSLAWPVSGTKELSNKERMLAPRIGWFLPPTLLLLLHSRPRASLPGGAPISPCCYHILLLPLRLRMPAADHCVSHLPRRLRIRRDCLSPLSTPRRYMPLAAIGVTRGTRREHRHDQ